MSYSVWEGIKLLDRGLCVYMYMYKSLFSAVNRNTWPSLQKQLQMWFCMKGTLKMNLWSLTVGNIWLKWYLTSQTEKGACMRCDKGEISPLNSTFWFQWSHACFWKTWVALNASKPELIGGAMKIISKCFLTDFNQKHIYLFWLKID